jgi:hypothetical protein
MLKEVKEHNGVQDFQSSDLGEGASLSSVRDVASLTCLNCDCPSGGQVEYIQMAKDYNDEWSDDSCAFVSAGQCIDDGSSVRVNATRTPQQADCSSCWAGETASEDQSQASGFRPEARITIPSAEPGIVTMASDFVESIDVDEDWEEAEVQRESQAVFDELRELGIAQERMHKLEAQVVTCNDSS